MAAIWMILMAVLLLMACAGDGPSDATQGPLATPIPTATPISDGEDTISSSDPLPTPTPTRTVPADMVKVSAPIENVEINIAESFPPQYFVYVVYGMPNGCVEYYGYEESRSVNAVTLTVTNLEPAPSEPIACAQVYRTGEINVPLGSEFLPGETYTVEVNDVTETFVAQ